MSHDYFFALAVLVPGMFLGTVMTVCLQFCMTALRPSPTLADLKKDSDLKVHGQTKKEIGSSAAMAYVSKTGMLHRDPTCSGMKAPGTVQLCKKCWG